MAFEGRAVTRYEWRELAERWLIDADDLLRAKRWPAAYYLSGYAVECGLKACLLNRVALAPELVLSDRKFSEECRTHSYLTLLKHADLKQQLSVECDVNQALADNWLLAKDWTEQSRYRLTLDELTAKKFYRAIAGEPNGVMPWIRAHW